MKMGVALADVIAGKDAAVAVLAALDRTETSCAPVSERPHRGVARAQRHGGAGERRAERAGERRGAGAGGATPTPIWCPTSCSRPPTGRSCSRSAAIRSGSPAVARSGARISPPTRSLATNAGRVRHRDRVTAAIAATLAARPAAEWVERLSRHDVPVGVVRPVTEALREVAADPDSGIAPLPPGTVRLPPPRLDEHGAAVRRAGWRAFEG